MSETVSSIFDTIFKLKHDDKINCNIYHHKWYGLEMTVNKRIMTEVKDVDGKSIFQLSYSCSLSSNMSETLNFKEEQLV